MSRKVKVHVTSMDGELLDSCTLTVGSKTEISIRALASGCIDVAADETLSIGGKYPTVDIAALAEQLTPVKIDRTGQPGSQQCGSCNRRLTADGKCHWCS